MGFGVIVEFFIDRLVAGVGSKTGDVEGSTWSGGVGHVGGSGTDTAGAKTSEEGSTVVLLRYGHREEAKEGSVDYVKDAGDEGRSTGGWEEEQVGRDAK